MTYYLLHVFQPIFLNEIMIKKKTEDDTDPCLFNISHIEHIFSLKAVSPTERLVASSYTNCLHLLCIK